MNEPTHDAIANIHHFTFAEYGVTATVNRIREDSRSINAYLVVRYNGRWVEEGRVNLESSRAKAEHAKECEARNVEVFADPETPWRAIINSICVLTLRKHRKGEPAIRMSEHVPSKALSYRVWPFLFDGHPNLVYGDGGTGKSLLADFAVTLVANGLSTGENGSKGFEVQFGPCLILDWESDADDLWRRLQGLRRGLGLDGLSPEIYHRYSARPLVDDLEEIQAMVVENDIDLVVVDSAAYAVGGDPQDEAQVIPFFNALRTLKVTSLIIGHVPKDNPSKNPFGSVFWRNGARSMWRVAHQQETGAHSFSMALFHTKTNLSEKLDSIGLRFSFEGNMAEDGTITVSPIEVSDEPDLVGESGDLTLRILSVLSEPLSYKEIAERINERNPKKVADTLSRHRVGNKNGLRELFVSLGGAWGKATFRKEGS